MKNCDFHNCHGYTCPNFLKLSCILGDCAVNVHSFICLWCVVNILFEKNHNLAWMIGLPVILEHSREITSQMINLANRIYSSGNITLSQLKLSKLPSQCYSNGPGNSGYLSSNKEIQPYLPPFPPFQINIKQHSAEFWVQTCTVKHKPFKHFGVCYPQFIHVCK